MLESMRRLDVKAAITKESRANNKRNAESNKHYKWRVKNNGVTTFHKLWVKANKKMIHEGAPFSALSRIAGR